MFDLKEVLAGADVQSDRLMRVAGTYFESVPAHGEVYTLKNVVHDWPEAKVVQLLERVREVIYAHKRLLIVEFLVPDGNQRSIVNWIDLNFLILVGSADRTEEEYRNLAARYAFEVTNLIPTSTGRHIIELALV